jgi:hypothetical protein
MDINHRGRGAKIVYKPVANAMVVAMYANHVSFCVESVVKQELKILPPCHYAYEGDTK